MHSRTGPQLLHTPEAAAVWKHHTPHLGHHATVQPASAPPLASSSAPHLGSKAGPGHLTTAGCTAEHCGQEALSGVHSRLHHPVMQPGKRELYCYYSILHWHCNRITRVTASTRSDQVQNRDTHEFVQKTFPLWVVSCCTGLWQHILSCW